MQPEGVERGGGTAGRGRCRFEDDHEDDYEYEYEYEDEDEDVHEICGTAGCAASK